MTTGRINQISIGADETAERFFRITLGSKRLCFDRLFFLLFFGFESKSKTRFNLGVDRRWEFLHSRCDHYKIWFCYYLLTSFSGWNPSERYIKMYRFPIFIQPSFSCVWKRKNSQPTSESRHGRNDVINGKPLKNTQAEDERFVWVDRSVKSWNF